MSQDKIICLDKQYIRQKQLIFDIIHYISHQTTKRPFFVSVSYKKLWKLLIDKEMNKTDLRLAAGVSTATLARLSKDELVTMDVLVRICKTLECNVGDIMDVVLDDDK